MATDQQKRFVESFLEECAVDGDYKRAGKLALVEAGYGESIKLSTVINSQGVKELLLDGVNGELAQKIPKLLFKLEGVVDDPTQPGAKRIIDVCSTLLDRAGVIKRDETTLTVKTPDGIVILPQKNKD